MTWLMPPEDEPPWCWWRGFRRKRQPIRHFTEEEVEGIIRAQEFTIQIAPRMDRPWKFEKKIRWYTKLGVTMKKFSPSLRSFLKLVRDGAVVAFGAFAVYLGSNAADAGVSAPVAAAIGPVALFVYRYLRELAGMGPAA